MSLNRDYNFGTVIGACDLSKKELTQGAPVTLGANGYKLAKKADLLAGLCFNYYTEDRNDVTGGDFFANSGKISVVQAGEVTLDKDVYLNADGTAKEVFPYDSSKTYAVNDLIYVDENGLLTNDASAKDAHNLVGRVVEAPAGLKTALKIALQVLPVAVAPAASEESGN